MPIHDNKRVTLDKVAEWWEINHGSPYALIHLKLHFIKSAGLISSQLSRI
jgi:hypothetical protein